MRGDDRARDREAEAGAAARPGPADVGAVEAVEDALALLRLDARAVVVDVDPQLAAQRGRGDGDGALGPGVAAGVLDQVADDPAEHLRVGLDPSRRRGTERRAPRRRLDRRPQKGGGVELAPRRPGPLVESRQRQHLLDQPFDPTQLAQGRCLDPLHRRRVGLGFAGEHFDLPADRGKWAAQLVRGVGDEAALSGEGVLEPVEHQVERVGERPQLGGRSGVGLNPGTEVAAVDLGRGGGEASQRRRRPRRQQVARRQGGDERDAAEEEERFLDVVLGLLDRRVRIAALPLRGARFVRLAFLLLVDHRVLVRHLRAHRDEDEAKRDHDDRPEGERQPAAQSEPLPA